MSKKQQNEKKQNVIQASGLQDAYEYLLRQLCKKGLPTGNVYEFAAQTILSYEKKLKNTNIQVKAQQAAKEAHEKYIKKLQDKEQKNLEEVSRYELAFREEQKRKEIYNQSLSQEPVQRSSIGKSAIEQRNQSVDNNDAKSPPKTQKKMPEKQNSPIKQEIKEKKEELDTSQQQQGQIQNQPQAQKDKKSTKKDTKKYDSSILKDLKIEEQKDLQKSQEQQVQDQKQNQQQQQQVQTKVSDQQKDTVKETQKEQVKEQPKQDQPKQDNKKQGKKK